MVYVFFAHGFEEMEAIVPLDVLRRAGLEVQSVGVGSKTVTGSHGVTIHCDVSDKETSGKGLEMVILPGGMPGTKNLAGSKRVNACIDYCIAKDVWIGAICAAPSILGNRGDLKGKKATCFPGWEEQLEGAVISPERVVVDGRIVTAKGAGSSMEFALKLVECLLGKEKAAELEASMQ